MKNNDTEPQPTARQRADSDLADWLSGRGSTVMAALLVLLIVGFVASLFW
jgi:hypothetical protein